MSLVFEHASKNPELKGLRGYKYTAEAVYSREWPFEALVSRGIVYDENGNVVAFPFRKFFNYEELFPENGGTEILDKVKFAQEQDIKKFGRSEEHTSELQSPDHLVCRLLLEKKKR